MIRSLMDEIDSMQEQMDNAIREMEMEWTEMEY